jgi:hypothetical protein
VRGIESGCVFWISFSFFSALATHPTPVHLDIKLFAATFSSASFRHVRRSVNFAAEYILARSCDFAVSSVIS